MAPADYFATHWSGTLSVTESLPAALWCLARSPDDPLEAIRPAASWPATPTPSRRWRARWPVPSTDGRACRPTGWRCCRARWSSRARSTRVDPWRRSARAEGSGPTRGARAPEPVGGDRPLVSGGPGAHDGRDPGNRRAARACVRRRRGHDARVQGAGHVRADRRHGRRRDRSGCSAGEWTDDTSMALCLAESLVDTGGLDLADQLRRYVLWWRDGYLSSNGRCFDIGNTTSSAAPRFERTGEAVDPAPDQEAAANGSLMRLAAVPIRWHPTCRGGRAVRRVEPHHPRRRPARGRVPGARRDGRRARRRRGPPPRCSRPTSGSGASCTRRSRRSPAARGRPRSRPRSVAPATASTPSRPRSGRWPAPTTSATPSSGPPTSATTPTPPPPSPASSPAPGGAHPASRRSGGPRSPWASASARWAWRCTTPPWPMARRGPGDGAAATTPWWLDDFVHAWWVEHRLDPRRRVPRQPRRRSAPAEGRRAGRRRDPHVRRPHHARGPAGALRAASSSRPPTTAGSTCATSGSRSPTSGRHRPTTATPDHRRHRRGAPGGVGSTSTAGAASAAPARSSAACCAEGRRRVPARPRPAGALRAGTRKAKRPCPETQAQVDVLRRRLT